MFMPYLFLPKFLDTLDNCFMLVHVLQHAVIPPLAGVKIRILNGVSVPGLGSALGKGS